MDSSKNLLLSLGKIDEVALESAAVVETETGVEAETAAVAAGVIAAETVTAFVAAPTAASRGGCGSPWYHAHGLFACGNRRRLE